MKSTVHHGAGVKRQKGTSVTGELAFTRVELLLVIAIVGVLASIGYMQVGRVKPVVKESVCVNNLKELAKGMAMYQQQYSEKLPMAYVRFSDNKFFNWDVLLIDYLRANMRTDPTKPAPSGDAVNKFLLCPEDVIPGVKWGPKQAKRRTYSMPNHDMHPSNWPPGPDNNTGVGLYWTVGAKQGLNTLANFYAFSNNVPAFRAAMILEPDDTLLVTEHAYFRNILANPGGSIIKTTGEHIHDAPEAEKKLTTLHGGKISYMMVDGHVESLFPDQTVGFTGGVSSNVNTHRGMWTIRAKD